MTATQPKPLAAAFVKSQLDPAPREYDPMEDKAIAQRAYEYWSERGRPYGSPEEDWYRAEREIRSHMGMLPPKIPE